ncbi:exported hypothetical protein [Agrobacterium fabrum str. J-07]|nr:exported hypothetical protein [Agrobacterium fabrum str. J-07]
MFRFQRHSVAFPAASHGSCCFLVSAAALADRLAERRGARCVNLADRRGENTLSWNPAIAPACPEEIGLDAIDTLIIPRSRDLGGSKFGAPCLRRSARWWDRSSSSIRSGLRNF